MTYFLSQTQRRNKRRHSKYRGNLLLSEQSHIHTHATRATDTTLLWYRDVIRHRIAAVLSRRYDFVFNLQRITPRYVQRLWNDAARQRCPPINRDRIWHTVDGLRSERQQQIDRNAAEWSLSDVAARIHYFLRLSVNQFSMKSCVRLNLGTIFTASRLWQHIFVSSIAGKYSKNIQGQCTEHGYCIFSSYYAWKVIHCTLLRTCGAWGTNSERMLPLWLFT